MNKKWLLSLVVLFLTPFAIIAQSGTANKDAAVNVFVTDFKNNPLNHEIIVFKSKVNAKEFQGLTDSTGKFTLRLPVGDTYEVLIWGFNDSTSYSFLDIPTPKGNAYYKDAFKVDIQYLPAKSFVLEDCNFETGKAILQPESYKVIDELVAFLQRKDDERIELQGHTDNVGKAPKNMILSQQRAQTVMAYVISKGIDPSRLTAKGYGMTKPIATNKTAAGKALNRRTEVKIL
ncbi:MAG: OmpA family protein [Ferruginibacter sp.]|nr:OmpA family protein [Ferruginibacter sp.]